MDISIPYYSDQSRISNSSIGWFIKKGPKFFRDMLDGKEEGLKGKFLDKGTMIHMYLLQPDEFWDNYIVAAEFDKPTSKQQLAFADNYVNSLELEAEKKLIQAYSDAYSTKGKSDDKVLLEATKMLETMNPYIEYLTLNRDSIKTIISWSELNMLKTIKENMVAHKKANELLFNLPDTFEVHNEFHINWDFPKLYHDTTVKCKSLLDRVAFDHTNKKIILMDLKTTADVNNFSHSMSEYDYRRQLSYYWMAIHWYVLKELHIDIEDYTFESYIISVQSNNGYQVRVFKIDPNSIENRLDTIANTIEEIAWHTKNNLWDQRREYYEGDGAEEIE